MSRSGTVTQLSPSDVFSQTHESSSSSDYNFNDEGSSFEKNSKMLSTPSLLISSISSEYNRKNSDSKSSSRRLYKSSLKKEKNENDNEKSKHSVSCIGSSVSLVDSYFRTIINDIFGDEEYISRDNLTKAFVELGIISKSETIIDRSVIRNEVMKWKIDMKTFDNEAAKRSILSAITGEKNEKFHKYVKSQTNAYFANKRHFKKTLSDKKKEEEIKEKKAKKPMKTYNLERLLMTKDEYKEERGSKTARKEYVPPPPPKVMSFMSYETRKIVRNSELGSNNQVERDEIFRKNMVKKTEKLSKDIKEEYENSFPVYPKNPAYELTPEQREEFEIHKKEKFEKSIPKYPYRPQITPWEDYLKIKEAAAKKKIGKY